MVCGLLIIRQESNITTMLLKYSEINFLKWVYGRFDVRFVKRFTELYGISPYYFKHEIPAEVDYRDWIDVKSEDARDLPPHLSNNLKNDFYLSENHKAALKHFGKPDSMDYYLSSKGMVSTYVFRLASNHNFLSKTKLRLLCLDNKVVAARVFRNMISVDPDAGCLSKKEALSKIFNGAFSFEAEQCNLYLDKSNGIGVKIMDSITDYDIMILRLP